MSKPTIGVDISKDHLDACRWPGGESLRVSNDAAGASAAPPLDRRGGGARRLGGDRRLSRRPRAGAYAKLNPARVRRFAEAIGTQAKTDRVDARLIARMGAMIAPRPQAPAPAVRADLHELQLARTALLRERTAATNRAGRLTPALLKRQHATRLRQIARALTEVDAAIAALVAADAGLARKVEILCSIPGVSRVTAAAILAEMPELGTLEAATAASLAGLAPFTRASGTCKGQAKIGGGPAALRRALYLPALTAARFNPDLEAVYDRLRAKGKPQGRARRGDAQAHHSRERPRP